jgi:transcriptional regulator with XRE-family HTH domain
MKIGEVIRKLRKAKKATLEEIAFVAGTDAANLSRIERDKQNVTPEILGGIANALEVPISSLYLIAEQIVQPYTIEAAGVIAPDRKTAEHIEDIIGKFMLLSAENQRLLLDFIDLILNSQKK